MTQSLNGGDVLNGLSRTLRLRPFTDAPYDPHCFFLQTEPAAHFEASSIIQKEQMFLFAGAGLRVEGSISAGPLSGMPWRIPLRTALVRAPLGPAGD